MNFSNKALFIISLVFGILSFSKSSAASTNGTSAVNTTAIAIDRMVLDKLWLQTDRHFEEGEYHHCINLSRIIVQGDPHNLDAYANSAWLLWSMDQDKDAVKMLLQGVQANPKTYFMYDELGLYYFMRKKDYAESVHYYELAEKCADCTPLSLHGLAHAYEKNGQLEEARDLWQKLSEMSTDQTRAAAQMNLKRLDALIQKKSQGDKP
jgi:tetratricopeptide (TPR) repeat protein